MFRYSETKTSTENRDIPLLSIKFYDSIFFETKMAPPRCFLVLWDNIFFCRKSWYSPLRHKVFRHPKLSETQKGSSMNFFGTVRRKIFDGKSWYSFHPPPPLSSLTFSDTKSFLKHRSVPPRNVSVQWDKKNRRRIVISQS